mgnify:CR=1 FL=1
MGVLFLFNYTLLYNMNTDFRVAEVELSYKNNVPYNERKKIQSSDDAYRVLLTRARAGMVICVPEGNPNKTVSGFWEDSTRLPEYYDGTYEYLKSLGIEEI